MFKENKTKLRRKKLHMFLQLKVTTDDACQTLNISILPTENQKFVCRIVILYPLSLEPTSFCP